jgi:hypothetical protein
VIPRQPAAFADETAQAGANLGIDEDHPDRVVQKDRIERPKPVVFEILEIVAEHRFVSAGGFREQVDRHVSAG